MFTYIQNILGDVFYGYIEVKCVNNTCNRVHKITRNNFYNNGQTDYSCNMGCALAAYNQTNKENDKENDK
jgi:hypothetical protein